jgi:hypothetical protein
MSAPRRVLLAYPTAWDRPQLEACRAAWQGRFEPVFGEPSDEASSWDEDALAWVDRAEREQGATGAAGAPHSPASRRAATTRARSWRASSRGASACRARGPRR